MRTTSSLRETRRRHRTVSAPPMTRQRKRGVRRWSPTMPEGDGQQQQRHPPIVAQLIHWLLPRIPGHRARFCVHTAFDRSTPSRVSGIRCNQRRMHRAYSPHSV